MRQNLIKAISFIVTFIISLSVISAIMNMGNSDMTATMESATYPTVSMIVNDHEVNTLFGYSSAMKANYLRDTLTILPEDRKLYVKIKLWNTKISGLAYEVRSLDTTRLIENTEVYDYIQQGDEITADFEIKDLIEKETEYLLVTIVTLENGENVKYYTRVMETEEIHTKEQLDFIFDFHERIFDKEQAKSLATYLESNEEGDNSTYQHVDIHSSFQQVTWGNLNIIRKYNLNTKILDMDRSTSSYLLKYCIDVKNGSETDTYLVNEFFRIRYTEQRIYLLNYERDMNQLFDPNNEVFVNDKIVLGITEDNSQLHENSDGSVVLFTQSRALYEYRNNEGNLARLFCFYDEGNMDIRTLHDENEIKILNMDEAGNATFAVYGYMNRGRHEGKVGVSVYFYDNSTNSIEEYAYIPYDKSFDMLRQDMSELSYINRKNKLYLYVDEAVYCVDVQEASLSKITDAVPKEQIVTSKSNSMIAWGGTTKSISLMDLSIGNTREIKAKSGEQVHAIGFVGEDFVYGISDSRDIIRDVTGSTITPMHTILIEDKTGNVLKEYAPENTYIAKAIIENSTIQMERIKKDSAGSYHRADSDQIMNSITGKATRNNITSVVTDERETIIEIAMISNVASSIHLQTPKEVLTEGERTVNIESVERNERYYVYAQGHIQGTYIDPSAAVAEASSVNGNVVDDSGNYIWQKGNRLTRCEISQIQPVQVSDKESSLAACIDAILIYEETPRNSQYLLDKGDTAMTLLSDNISGRVLNLAGCDLSSVLYYVGRKTPVLASADNENSVLIVGFDEKNVILMDPITGSTYKKGMNDSTNMFKAAGNKFICYVKADE